MNRTWIDSNPREFNVGDIICDKDQSFLRLIIYKDNIALQCIGLVHCAFTENCDKHPIFPIYFNEIGICGELLKLGNLSDFSSFITKVREEVICTINNIEGYYNYIEEE